MSELRKYRGVIRKASIAYILFLDGVTALQRKSLLDGELSSQNMPLKDDSYGKADLDSMMPLDSNIKDQMEYLFNEDFSRVKVHRGPYAEEIARNMNARAFTVGQDIYFGAGEYSPQTEEGIKLLAHELEHTVQNSRQDRLLYKEDIEEAENRSSQIEKILGGLELSHFSKTLLDDSGARIGEEDILREVGKSSKENGADFDMVDTLDEFSQRPEKKNIRYRLADGKIVELTQGDYHQLVHDIIGKLNEELGESQKILPREDFDRQLNKLLEAFQVYRM